MSSPWLLVVDDDDDLRATTLMLLTLRGYTVVGAADGLDALTVMRTKGRPGLILLDQRMPRMNGEELAATLHDDPAFASTPIVLFSGDANANEVAASLGVQALLKKPVCLPDLLAAIERSITKDDP